MVPKRTVAYFNGHPTAQETSRERSWPFTCSCGGQKRLGRACVYLTKYFSCGIRKVEADCGAGPINSVSGPPSSESGLRGKVDQVRLIPVAPMSRLTAKHLEQESTPTTTQWFE